MTGAEVFRGAAWLPHTGEASRFGTRWKRRDHGAIAERISTDGDIVTLPSKALLSLNAERTRVAGNLVCSRQP